jgi:hypothetical protein
MKLYEVTGVYQSYAIEKATFTTTYPDIVNIELWTPVKGAFILQFHNEKDYFSILFHKRDGTTARKYLNQLNLTIIKAIF